MSEKTWNINGKHFKFDFGDLECANRYDAACREMKRRSETVPEFESRQDLIRYYCESFFAFYDDIFGAGTADQIFNGRYNMDLCDQVYDEFLGWVTKSVKRLGRKKIPALETRRSVNDARRQKRRKF